MNKLLSRSKDERCDGNNAEQETVQSGLFPQAEFQSRLSLIKETINTSNAAGCSLADCDHYHRTIKGNVQVLAEPTLNDN